MKLINNKNIFCSVSAGYSSVMMAIKMKEWFPNHNIINVMANTSREDDDSLDFMNKCDNEYGLNLFWIESVISQEAGVGSNYKLTKFEELDRRGDIFEQGIKKYGIPSVANKWCNRELKLVPLTKFANDYFGYKNYSVAVGIRSDEIDRVSKDYFSNNIFYPLADKCETVRTRNKFWSNKSIKLNIPAFKGNCKKCFEKSDRKLFTIIKDEIENGITDHWELNMEEKYSQEKIIGKEVYNQAIDRDGGAFFYRKNRSIKTLIELSKKPFKTMNDEYVYEADLFDFEEDCGAGCIVFT